jgi:hypothetical protein
VKEIKVLAGITEDHMSEVLHVGLKNDTTPETFSLQYVNSAGVCIPTQFIKLMPMLSVPRLINWHIVFKNFAFILNLVLTDKIFIFQFGTSQLLE